MRWALSVFLCGFPTFVAKAAELDIVELERTPDLLFLRWEAVPNSVYMAEVSSDLQNWDAFPDVQVVARGDRAAAYFSLALPWDPLRDKRLEKQRFFRVRRAATSPPRALFAPQPATPETEISLFAVINFTVTAQGKVANARIVTTNHFPFASSAREAVRARWYRSAIEEGRRVPANLQEMFFHDPDA